jgi:hypothetical protein
MHAVQSSKGTRSAAKSTSKAASRSASKGSGAGAGGSSVAQLAKRLDYADAASLRRQSTARAVAGGAGAAWEQDEGQRMTAFLSPAAAQRLRCRSARAGAQHACRPRGRITWAGASFFLMARAGLTCLL